MATAPREGLPVRSAYAPENNVGLPVRSLYAPENNVGLPVRSLYAPENTVGYVTLITPVEALYDKSPPALIAERARAVV